MGCHEVATRSAPLRYAPPPMEPPAPRAFPPAEAGTLLIVATSAVIGAATLAGWAAGSATGGLVVGAVAGVPVGIVAVYRRYRGFFR